MSFFFSFKQALSLFAFSLEIAKNHRLVVYVPILERLYMIVSRLHSNANTFLADKVILSLVISYISRDYNEMNHLISQGGASMSSVNDKFYGLPTTGISDALGGFNHMDSAIKPLKQSDKMAGRAF